MVKSVFKIYSDNDRVLLIDNSWRIFILRDWNRISLQCLVDYNLISPLLYALFTCVEDEESK